MARVETTTDLRPEHKVELSGWLSAQIAAGHFPKFGYPKNGLPETKSIEVEISGGFTSARDDRHKA